MICVAVGPKEDEEDFHEPWMLSLLKGMKGDVVP